MICKQCGDPMHWESCEKIYCDQGMVNEGDGRCPECRGFGGCWHCFGCDLDEEGYETDADTT